MDDNNFELNKNKKNLTFIRGTNSDCKEKKLYWRCRDSHFRTIASKTF